MNDDLAYGTMGTDTPQTATGSNERVERPKNDRRKTTYTFPIKIMPSPKSTTSTSLTEEFTEVETQAYYNESLDYNYISSRFAFSLGLRPDADREAKPRSKSVSKPRIPFKPKQLARSQTAPVSEIKPLQRSRTEPLSRRIFSPLSRDSTDDENTSITSTITNTPLPPRIPPRRTSTTATLVPSNSQAPPIFSLLEATPGAISRSNLTSPLFPDADLNPFSPRPGATFGAIVVDTPPRTPQRPKLLQTQTEDAPSLFEALNSHPVIPMPQIPTILTAEAETISEEPEDIPEESERNLEGMGTGTGIGMGFGIGEEVRGREHDDPNTMSGDLTLHWKSSPLSRYTQRTVFWIVPNAKFDVVFGHDETDFNIPVQNSMKWGLGGWGLGGGCAGGGRGRRAERNQFREGIRRGVLRKVEEQSSFSLLHSATNIMDMWLRPPYPTHVRGSSRDSDFKSPLLAEQGRNIHDVPLTYPELENQLGSELNCTEERRRKHEGKRAVNIWDVRAGKAVLAEQAKGASGEIRKLVGAVVKDVKAKEGGKRAVSRENLNGVGRAPPAEEDAGTTYDKNPHVENVAGSSGVDAVATASNQDITGKPEPQPEISRPISPLNSRTLLKIDAAPEAPIPALTLPNPATFELSPTTANQTANQSPSSSLRVEFTDAQIQAQIQAQMDREAEREAERNLEREMQAQMEREIQEQMEEEMRAQAKSPRLPPRLQRFSIDAYTASESAPTKASETLSPNTQVSISKVRPAHAHQDDDGESDDEGNEAMSEINLSKIPVQKLELDDGYLGQLEGMPEVSLPGPAFGSLRERFGKKWEMEDERIHAERKVWRRRFSGILGELVKGREVRV